VTAQGFAVYDTPIGHCGIVWDDHAVIGSQLPQADAESTRARVRRRFPAAAEREPSPQARECVEAVRALLLGGDPAVLRSVPLDLSRVPPFHARVYELVRTIPVGRTMTYGEVAAELGEPGSARAVGQAMGSNPFAPIVPCHRVVAAGGGKGGFSAHGGTRTKVRILEIEGVHLEEPTLFDL